MGLFRRLKQGAAVQPGGDLSESSSEVGSNVPASVSGPFWSDERIASEWTTEIAYLRTAEPDDVKQRIHQAKVEYARADLSESKAMERARSGLVLPLLRVFLEVQQIKSQPTQFPSQRVTTWDADVRGCVWSVLASLDELGDARPPEKLRAARLAAWTIRLYGWQREEYGGDGLFRDDNDNEIFDGPPVVWVSLAISKPGEMPWGDAPLLRFFREEGCGVAGVFVSK